MTISQCSTSTCGAICGNHHKNLGAISDQIYNEQREVNHIYILFSNRSNVFCYSSVLGGNNEISNSWGCVIGNRPVVHIKEVPGETREEKLAILSITLIHELAHAMGMYEINRTHHPKDQDICAMDNQTVRSAKQLYKYIIELGYSTFCVYCQNKICNKIYTTDYYY